MCFIHSRLSRLCFVLKRDIVDHRDIQLLFFFNRDRCQFFMNVYSDNLHTAVNFLSREALNIPNLLYMGRDFNIRDAEWDPSVSSHPAAGQSLRDLADSYSLVRSPSLSTTQTLVVMLTPLLTLFFFFFFVHQFITWYLVAVCSRLSTTSSLQF